MDQVRVYHPRQSDSISFDTHEETQYEGQRSSNGSSRSHPGKSKGSRKTSSEESKGSKSSKGNTRLEDPRLKRNGSEHGDQKRPTPVQPQGIKRTVPSSISSRKYKYRRPNNPSQGPQSIAGPSHQLDTRQCMPPIEGSTDKEQECSDSSETLSLLPTEQIKEARRNTRGAMGSTAEQPQEKEPQHGSLRWISNIHDVQELWFQQDGATCHTTRATIDLLKDTFDDRLISRFGPVNWPSRSCDLTPLDYFLWGFVKPLVYADKPQTLDHLEGNIRRVIADIRPQMFEKSSKIGRPDWTTSEPAVVDQCQKSYLKCNATRLSF
ncbi:DUF4817 domain-containing protein [Trichonephila clavipes]|nr:DUF4817 domain-containing protein [Trichonephila clavipes]